MGELCRFSVEWDPVVAPDFITAEYVYREDGTFGVEVSWDLDKNEWFVDFILLRYSDPNNFGSEDLRVRTTEYAYFDEVEPGTYYYRVLAEYAAGGGVCQQSAFAPNLYDPELDYAMVEVTSVNEQPDQTYAYPNPVSEVLHLANGSRVEAFDVLGVRVYQGYASDIDVSNWNNGIYFLRMTTSNGAIVTQKVIKK